MLTINKNLQLSLLVINMYLLIYQIDNCFLFAHSYAQLVIGSNMHYLNSPLVKRII